MEPDPTSSTSDPRPPTPSPVRRMAVNTAIVGGAFIISRVLGLLREAVIAGQFGTSGQYDAYVAAFGVPDTLFLLIIGGAVGSAFIPVFTGLERTGKPAQAWHLASTLINASVVLLSLSGIIMGVAAPALVAWIIAPGLTPERQALVVDLTRILLLSPLFMGLGGWAQGILNARQRFALSALAPVFYNLAIIAGALFLVPFWGIYGLAWGVVVGAMLHFGVQVPGLVRVGMRYSLRLNVRDEGAGEVGKLILPRILGQAAFQANIIAVRAIGSFLSTGRISALNYSYQLMMLPHGVFALSLATVTFPTMAAQYAEGNLDGMRSTLARAVKVLLFLTLPSAVGLFMLREEIVIMLFQLGAFQQRDTQLVASALGYFSLGLVAYAVVEVLTRGFYALHDTATPVAVSVATVVLNIGLSLALVQWLHWGYWGHEGLALSLAITTTVEMVLMWVLLGRKLPGWGLGGEGLLLSIAKSGAAAVGMGLVLAFALPALRSLLPVGEAGKLAAIVLTLVGIGLGALTYLGIARLLRSEEVQAASSMLFRRFRRRTKDGEA
ncbi:MAG TPA: murein biosynthesis integral membrane protein MurJ [Chloroflexia bacterium]|nr:murein biosynthesis integral membrane protein MurJ [Chloroflexia bacterium]